MKLLHIDSSVLGTNSVTRTLGAEVVRAWQRSHPGIEVIHRDLVSEPLAHLDPEILGAGPAGSDDRTPRQVREHALGERLVEELREADVVVIGAPMYNFAIPSQLKAWIDRVLVAGKTFRYTADGPEGLLRDRPVIVVSGRGGVYSTGAASTMDFQESYLRAALSFIGIRDVRVVRAEGMNMGPDVRRKALAEARCEIGPELVQAA